MKLGFLSNMIHLCAPQRLLAGSKVIHAAHPTEHPAHSRYSLRLALILVKYNYAVQPTGGIGPFTLPEAIRTEQTLLRNSSGSRGGIYLHVKLC